MKKLLFGIMILVTTFLAQSCDNKEARYVNPNTGESIDLKKDDESGLMVDAETGKPVSIYVDTETSDTIWGRNGKVVNGKLRRNKGSDGIYVYVYETNGDDGPKTKQEDNEYKVKGDDYKKEVEKDGDITIKDGDTKIKIDGKTGERKVKKDD